MFATLRRMIVPIIGVVLFLFVALIILEWGFDISGRRKTGPQVALAGKINGEDITWEQYNFVRDNVFRNANRDTTQEMTDERRKQLERQAWNEILQQQLLMQQAKKLHVKVTPDDVYAFLKYSPPAYLQNAEQFRTNGQFDYQKYVNAMADPANASLWAQVEQMVQGDIMIQKVQLAVIEAATVSDPEIRQAWLDSLETARVAAVVVPYSRFAGQFTPATDDESKAYYEKHKNKYQMEEHAMLNIVMYDGRAGEGDWMRARDRATHLYDSIKAGADFHEVAKAYSEDAGTAPVGGDLGWFEPGRMVHEFDSAAFAMKPGELSTPIRTGFGWHILKHDGFRESSSPDAPKGSNKLEAHVFHILIKVTPSDETRDEAVAKLAELAQRAKKEGFQKTADALGLKVQKTSIFFPNDPMQFIGESPEANKFAFSNKDGAISDVLSNDLGSFVVEVALHAQKGIAGYEESKTRIGQDVFKEKVAMKCHDTTAAILNEYKTSGDLKKAASRHGAELKDFDAFNRNSFVAGVGRDAAFTGTAFSLSRPGEVSPVVDYSAGSAIIQLIERTSPDLTSFTAMRDSVANAVRFAKQQDMYGRWFDQLVKGSEIVNNTSGTATN